MHCVNAIPYVCEAEPPGIKTYLDLPLLAGRGARAAGRLGVDERRAEEPQVLLVEQRRDDRAVGAAPEPVAGPSSTRMTSHTSNPVTQRSPNRHRTSTPSRGGTWRTAVAGMGIDVWVETVSMPRSSASRSISVSTIGSSRSVGAGMTDDTLVWSGSTVPPITVVRACDEGSVPAIANVVVRRLTASTSGTLDAIELHPLREALARLRNLTQHVGQLGVPRRDPLAHVRQPGDERSRLAHPHLDLGPHPRRDERDRFGERRLHLGADRGQLAAHHIQQLRLDAPPVSECHWLVYLPLHGGPQGHTLGRIVRPSRS